VLRVERLDFAAAAALPVAFGTAWNALVSTSRVGPEDTVLVWGGGSGLGHAAVQIARLLGSKVIATAGDQSKLEKVREIGASYTINHNTEDVVLRVSEITGGDGVSVVFDHIGGGTWDKSLSVLRKGGKLLSLGVTTGESASIEIGRLYRNELKVMGVYAYTKEDLSSVLKLAEEGRLKPHIHREIPLSMAQEAHSLLESRRLFGKLLLIP
jgi:alcohol dehydrogenase